MILLGLHGKAQSGKDTAYSYIEEWCSERGLLSARQGFADRLKLSAARIFWPEIGREDAIKVMDAWKKNAMDGRAETGSYAGFAIEELMIGLPSRNAGSMFSPEPTEPKIRVRMDGRTFLQRYGTESHRDVFGEDFWTDALLPRDEFRMLKNWGNDEHRLPAVAVITDVRFPNEARRIRHHGGQVWCIERAGIDKGDTHASEQVLDSKLIDLYVDNNLDIDTYRETIRSMCDLYLAEVEK